MPLYDYQCPECGRVEEVFARHTDAPPECHGPMVRMLSACALSPDIANWDAYVSPASGKLITSKKQRLEDMRRTNTRPWEGMASETKEAQRRKAYAEQKQDAKLHDAVSRAFYALPDAKRRELSRG